MSIKKDLFKNQLLVSSICFSSGWAYKISAEKSTDSLWGFVCMGGILFFSVSFIIMCIGEDHFELKFLGNY